jgi:hypothetical protein
MAWYLVTQKIRLRGTGTTLPSACFEAFAAVTFQVEVLYVVMCSVVVGYQRFRRPCRLHLHPEDLDLKFYFNIISNPIHYFTYLSAE